MSSTKIINAIVLAVGVGLVAWGLTFVHAPQAALVPASDYTESGKYYDIKVAYPAVPAAERAVIEAAFAPDVADFKQAVDGLDPSIMPSLADYKLSYDAEFVQYLAPGYTSYVYAIYEDTGGAHPNSFFKTFIFDQVGKQVSLAQVLGANPQWLQKLSTRVSADVTAQLKQRLETDDVTGALYTDGLAPQEENFQNFAIDGTDLLVEIPPYQAAAYAAGTFEVRIPLSDLR